eukprot:3526639-Alexandrium_andersonii.AAC.1
MTPHKSRVVLAVDLARARMLGMSWDCSKQIGIPWSGLTPFETVRRRLEQGESVWSVANAV